MRGSLTTIVRVCAAQAARRQSVAHLDRLTSMAWSASSLSDRSPLLALSNRLSSASVSSSAVRARMIGRITAAPSPSVRYFGIMRLHRRPHEYRSRRKPGAVPDLSSCNPCPPRAQSTRGQPRRRVRLQARLEFRGRGEMTAELCDEVRRQRLLSVNDGYNVVLATPIAAASVRRKTRPAE